MSLLAAGCSIVFGDELADCTATKPSNHTFPALLAKALRLDYQCVAVPGSGSDSQVRKVLENLNDSVNFVVVSWSYIHRYDWHWAGKGWSSLRFTNSVAGDPDHEKQADHFKQCFYTNVSEDYAWYNYARDIVFLQNWLTCKQVPYLFCGVDSGFTVNASLQSSYQQLWNSIDRNRWFNWHVGNQSLGFQDWCMTNAKSDTRFTLGSGGHPKEFAHAETARQMIEFIKQRNLT
jgi:hypothetical protein